MARTAIRRCNTKSENGYKGRFLHRHVTDTSRYNSALLKWHETLEIIYLVKGKFSITVGSESRTIYPGEAVILNILELHAITSADVGSYYFWVDIPRYLLDGDRDESLQKNLITPLFNRQIIFNNWPGNSAALVEQMEKLRLITLEKEPYWELRFRAEIFNLVHILVRNHQTSQPAERLTDPNRLSYAVEFIQRNYPLALSRESIAKVTGFSPDYFGRVFYKAYKETPIHYLNRIRCQNAAHYLKTTNLSVVEISTMVGFSTSSYFAVIFRQFYGMTPTEYREKIREKTSK